MYATVRTYSASPEMADALVRNADSVKSLIGGIEGFQAYYLVRTDDGAVSISVYDDEAGANESTRAAASWIGENLPGIAVEGGGIFSAEPITLVQSIVAGNVPDQCVGC